MGDPVILRKLAIDMIKRNNLSKAKLALFKSLSLDPNLHDTHTLLGDILFLENKKDLALQHYLAAMHLLIHSSIKNLDNHLLDNDFEDISDDMKKTLPSKYAVYILNDSTISYHLGHALLNNSEYEKIFKDALINKMTLNSTLNKYNIDSENYLEYRNSTIIPLGREFLINNIIWSSIFSNSVSSFYLKN